MKEQTSKTVDPAEQILQKLTRILRMGAGISRNRDYDLKSKKGLLRIVVGAANDTLQDAEAAIEE